MLPDSTPALKRFATREEWLQAATSKYRDKFKAIGVDLPATIYISVGLPKGRKAIGECWHGEQSEDGNKHVFISPVLSAWDALDTLGHELVHVALPAEIKGKRVGHRKPFVELGNKLGLTAGKATSLGAGPELSAELTDWLCELGEYPHALLDPTTGKKPQSTRLLKAECPSCGYTVRVTGKWLDYAGPPLCPAKLCEKQQLVAEGWTTEVGDDD